MSKELEYLCELQEDLNTCSDEEKDHYGNKYKAWYNLRLNTLRKLVVRATPKKVKPDGYSNTFECPNCKEIIQYDYEYADHNNSEYADHKHCLNCGQALKWSDD